MEKGNFDSLVAAHLRTYLAAGGYCPFLCICDCTFLKSMICGKGKFDSLVAAHLRTVVHLRTQFSQVNIFICAHNFPR